MIQAVGRQRRKVEHPGAQKESRPVQSCRFLFLVLVLLAVQVLGAPAPVLASTPVSSESAAVIIRFAPDTEHAERSALLDVLGVRLIRWIEPLAAAQVEVVGDRTRALHQLQTLATGGRAVAYIEPDSMVQGVPVLTEPPVSTYLTENRALRPPPVLTNDPDFNHVGRVYSPHIMRVPQAWRYSMGDNKTIVAIVDSGINANHPDLAGRVLPGYDFVNDDDNPQDDHGHGTHVAGIVAATANNGIGSAGVCPGCVLLPVKVLNESNTGTWAAVAAGIVYAVDQGAQIINLSLGSHAAPRIVRDAIAYAEENDVLVVAAAGNMGNDRPFMPAALPNVIGVGATDHSELRWQYSNHGDWIDVTAPGASIYSTYGVSGGDIYAFMSGTSMAAPHVAGLAGLLHSQDPARTAEDLHHILISTADDLGAAGKDATYGYGRINALAALQAETSVVLNNATLEGVIWQDGNRNGSWDAQEPTLQDESQVVVRVEDMLGQTVAKKTVDSLGRWRFDGLYAGVYRITAAFDDEVLLTSPAEYRVNLQNNQVLKGLNFGYIEIKSQASHSPVYLPLLVGN